MPELTHVADSNISANTAIDLSEHMDEPFDTRQGVDPIRNANHYDDSGSSTTDLTSQGQVSVAGDPSGGEIGVLGPYSVAVGDAIDSPDQLILAYDAAGDTERAV